ncbi:MAG: GH92 family glycosyl hydrolase [Bacteroidales bacterium]|nr:GH92 family glycosyl hydrolase [Candidatus Liminaster caballi]
MNCLLAGFLSLALSYVDPMIGAEGQGRVFVGPSMPYGMVKPSPDCTSLNNSGWAKMPTPVDGFSQTHVSGTGGGPKYGNVLIQPFITDFEQPSHRQLRDSEQCALGLYKTTYDNGIAVEVTASEHASYYHISYPDDSPQYLTVDAGWFLGNHSAPDLREQQQFVGSEIEIVSDHEIAGFTRIRGGWNNGKAYTVFFHLTSDHPFVAHHYWDTNGQRGVNVELARNDDKQVELAVGISFVGERKARENAKEQPGFLAAYNHCIEAWEGLLGRVDIDPKTPDDQKRMFYTALYHTMLEPVDRTGENPGWTDYIGNDPKLGEVPYYDDFYAIWDTYRTSMPLVTLLDPQRQTDIVNSLLNIYKRDGYMPDARSGNSNGRTQGGSNADIVLADALAKGLEGIDWNMALDAMLKDATVPPGGNEEAEGRGGLVPYLELGYVPYGIARAGTRTVEYSFNDWAIAQMAKHLGRQDLYDQYMRQADSWKNLWRADYENDGTRGFIMPKDKDGQWLERLPFGHSRRQPVSFEYNPTVSYEGPWYVAWWDCFFYEASSWEYSLSVPHDVPALIEACGGAEAFERRLDTFFDHGYYNIANEPSFLSPCLYHWIGKPERTSERVLGLIRDNWNDSPTGIPGNDDSGAMSSWLAFHMMGFYPNAGHDYYLLHEPALNSLTIHLPNGNDLRIAKKQSKGKLCRVTFNGKEMTDWRITHQQLSEGGELLFELPKTAKKSVKEQTLNAAQPQQKKENLSHDFVISFSLHGQTRNFDVGIDRKEDGTLCLQWGIVRHEDYWTGSYSMTPEALEKAASLCYTQPVWHQHLMLSDQTFCILPRQALRDAKELGHCRFNNTDWKLIENSTQFGGTLHLQDTIEGAEMWVANDDSLPLIMKMNNNPVEINWQVKQTKK